MTAHDVLTYLEQLQVQLTLTPQGQLRYRAPRGVMTLVLQGTIKTYKAQLTQLLTTGEDVELPRGREPARNGLQSLSHVANGQGARQCADDGRAAPRAPLPRCAERP